MVNLVERTRVGRWYGPVNCVQYVAFMEAKDEYDNRMQRNIQIMLIFSSRKELKELFCTAAAVAPEGLPSVLLL